MSPQEDADHDQVIRINNYTSYFVAVYLSILLVVGIPGNILTIFVLQRRRMKDGFISTLLTWLAVSNLSVMFVNAFPRFLRAAFEVKLARKTVVLCYTHFILQFVTVTTSNWILVLVTACRVIYINSTRQAIAVFTPYLIHRMVLILCTLLLIIRMLIIFLYQMEPHGNGPFHEDNCPEFPKALWRLILSAVNCYIPGLLLLTLNWCLIVAYRKHVRRSSSMISQHNLGRNLTLLVMLSNVLFIACALPYTILFPFEEKLFPNTVLGRAYDEMALTITVCILYTSASVNFLVYCFFGARFRHELSRVFVSVFGPCFSTLLNVSYSPSTTITPYETGERVSSSPGLPNTSKVFSLPEGNTFPSEVGQHEVPALPTSLSFL